MQKRTIVIEIEAETYDYIAATLAADFESVAGFAEAQLLTAVQREARRHSDPPHPAPGRNWDRAGFVGNTATLENIPGLEFRDIEDGETGYPFLNQAAVPFVVPTATHEAFRQAVKKERRPYLWFLAHLVSHDLRYRFSLHRRNPGVEHCEACGATWENTPESRIQEPRQAGEGETLVPLPEELGDLVFAAATLTDKAPGDVLAEVMEEYTSETDGFLQPGKVAPCHACDTPTVALK